MDFSAIRSVPLENAIAGPLLACNKAQSRFMEGTYLVLRSFFWNKGEGSLHYSPAYDYFYFLQENGGQRLQIPRMCLFPVPTMQLEDLSVTFQARVTKVSDKTLTVRMLNESTEVASHSRLYSYLNVRLNACASDIPTGLARFYELCSEQMTSVTRVEKKVIKGVKKPGKKAEKAR